MTNFQKTVKTFAIAFALFLAVSIVGMGFSLVTGILNGISGAAGLVKYAAASVPSKQTEESAVKKYGPEEIKSIRLEQAVGEVCFKTGPEFKVSWPKGAKGMKCQLKKDGTLRIENETPGIFWPFSSEEGAGRVEITVPEDFEAEFIRVEGGFGNINMNGVRTRILKIESGMGEVRCEDLVVAEEAKIESGTGAVSLSGIQIKDLDLEGGIGSIYIQGLVTGDSSVSIGIGQVAFSLEGEEEDYDFQISTGLGSIYINGELQTDLNHTNRAANNSFKIEGGVGECRVDFE